MTDISPMLLDNFYRLFSGNKSAYGQFKYGTVTEEGEKRKGSAKTEIKPVTIELYEKHLTGKMGLGVVPISEDDKCIFGVIDVDEYPVDTMGIINKIKRMDLPLVCFRSKSGGLHIYLFLSAPAPAVQVKESLYYMATALGYSKIEIFPKQSKLNGSVGNWINLPYYNYSDSTLQYCYDVDGNELLLEEAIDYINVMKVSPKNLDQITSDLPYSDAPPCLQQLIASGAPSGTRNKFLFNVGVYLKQKFGDDYEAKLIEINNSQPEPLSLKEITNTTLKSLSRKEYFYTCEDEPIKSFCNKEVCRGRLYGIDSDLMPDVIMGTLKKLASDPPLWTINIDGIDVDLDTQQLMSQGSYQKACIEHIHKYPKTLKAEKWRRLIQERLDAVEVIEAPAETGVSGTFKEHLREFCTERDPARDKIHVEMGKVYSDDKFHYFKGRALYDYLTKNKGFIKYNAQRMYKKIRDMGGGATKLYVDVDDPNRKNKKVRKQIRVYKVPIFDEFRYLDDNIDFSNLNIEDEDNMFV